MVERRVRWRQPPAGRSPDQRPVSPFGEAEFGVFPVGLVALANVPPGFSIIGPSLAKMERVVEGARLESVYTVKGIKGSNPFLSAKNNFN